MKSRQSLRLSNYDYSQPGYYFVTICTKGMSCWLGAIKNNAVELSSIGKAAQECWLNIPRHFPHVELDEYIVMPNHVHGIIIINPVGVQNINPVGVQNFEPLQQNKFQHIIPLSLGSIVRGFKIGVTQWCRRYGHIDLEWQRNYYDHIILNEKALQKIREYIQNNPANWAEDRNNPRK